MCSNLSPMLLETAFFFERGVGLINDYLSSGFDLHLTQGISQRKYQRFGLADIKHISFDIQWLIFMLGLVTTLPKFSTIKLHIPFEQFLLL